MGEIRHHYTDEERENAVRCYVAGGSYSKAEAMCGVPKTAMAVWKHRDPQWWDDTITKIHMEMEEQYRAGWREVLGLGLDAMQDRLRNGNHMPIKVKKEDGTFDYEMVRVPVPAKDAVVISGIAADKLRVSMGLPNRITGKVEDNDRLESLRKMAEASRAARTGKEPSEPATLQ
jgi:hypothetical protein